MSLIRMKVSDVDGDKRFALKSPVIIKFRYLDVKADKASNEHLVTGKMDVCK